MKNSYFILPVFFLISFSCVHISGRKIASAPLTPPPLDNLLEASIQILSDVEDYNFPEACVGYLKELEVNVDAMDVRKLPLGQLSVDAEKITKNSWQIRSALHSRLAEFDKNCALQVQASFRQFRFIEDYLLELSRNVGHKIPSEIDFQKQPVPMMDITVPFYEMRVNNQVKFEPGDLLITRGVSFLSGMIARLGKRSTQFSHVVMVYQDPKTQEIKTIESYVGIGVAFYDMEFALKNENARILWLRAKDRSMGKKASEMMGKLVAERLVAKNPIKYDYELDFNNPATMSCAEVSQVAFQMASDNKVKIPFYPNEISGAKSIIERLHLVEGETYEPGDMEIDPRFELVGEFQDLRLTRDSRQKDAIMSVMFEWMEKKDYELKDNMKSRMAGGIIYSVRRTFLWPLVKKLLKLDDFSKEIPRNMLKTVTLVNQLGEVMLADLKARDIAFEKKHGVPMSYMDFYKALEEMRQEDLKLYEKRKTRKHSKIHKLIRVRN
jgi:hypothetical protein